MPYIDCFVLPVPKGKEAAYFEMARTAGAVWREHGALSYREAIADDVKPGVLTSFPQAVNLKPDEEIIIAWITFESRTHRDAVNAKVMADPRLADMMNPDKALFDMSRMMFGGFEVRVEV